MNKQVFVMFIVLIFSTGVGLVNSAQAKTKYLKGNQAEIAKTMMEWNKALGVACGFCHTSDNSQNYQDLAGKTATKEQLSALVHKRIARAMLGNMLYLNQKEGKKDTCNTCHQGKAEVKVK